jgi:hypothetical protein
MPQHIGAAAGQSAAALHTVLVSVGHCTSDAHVADICESSQQAFPPHSPGPLHPLVFPSHEVPFAAHRSVCGGVVVMQHVCVARSHGARPQHTSDPGNDAPTPWQTGAELSGPATGSPAGAHRVTLIIGAPQVPSPGCSLDVQGRLEVRPFVLRPSAYVFGIRSRA